MGDTTTVRACSVDSTHASTRPCSERLFSLDAVALPTNCPFRYALTIKLVEVVLKGGVTAVEVT